MTRKPPPETPVQGASSRRDRLVARRSRRSHRTRISVGFALVVILGAIAVGAYALNADDPPAHASPGNAAGGALKFGRDGTLIPANSLKQAPPRRLDHAHPLNLWVGGDSLAGSFGPALGDQLGALGIVKTTIDYKVSSGLSSNDIRNWYERAGEQMTARNPDAVVFIIGTNDAPIVNQVDANGDGVPDWQAEYRLKVARMMDLLVGPNHRPVIWLGPPTLGDNTMDRGAKAIGPVMRQEAAKRARDVTYLDTYKLFSDSNGEYSRQIRDENGKEITARISDGTHFTEDGAQYLARAVFTVLDARWRLSKQADLKDPIGWTFADGTGELVPGFSSRPTSRYKPSRSHNCCSSSETTSPPQDTTVVTSDPTTVEQSTSPTTSPPVATTSPPHTTAPTTNPTPPPT